MRRILLCSATALISVACASGAWAQNSVKSGSGGGDIPVWWPACQVINAYTDARGTHALGAKEPCDLAQTANQTNPSASASTGGGGGGSGSNSSVGTPGAANSTGATSVQNADGSNVDDTDREQPGTGTLTATDVNHPLVITLKGHRNQLRGAFTGLVASGAVLIAETSIDNSKYVPKPFVTLTSAQKNYTNGGWSSDGNFAIDIAGALYIRFRVMTAGSSNPTLVYNASASDADLDIPKPITASPLETPNTATTLARDGVDATGATQATGGVGARGWQSGIKLDLDSVIAPLGTASSKALGIMASDGTAVAKDATLTSGNVRVGLFAGTLGTVAGSPLFMAPGTGQTFPISAASLPLPAGAATATNQVAGTTAGTSATSAEPIQGVNGGVPVSNNPASFARAVLDTTTITAANTYQTVAAAGTAPHEVVIENTTPYGTSGKLYIDPTGATGTTLSSAAITVDPPQSSTTRGERITIPTSSSAITIYATGTGVTFKGWKG